MKKRLLPLLLAIILVFGAIPITSIAESGNFPITYETSSGSFKFEKISHPYVSPNAPLQDLRNHDGVVDYVGNGIIGVGENGFVGTDSKSGDRGQSYSWSAIAHGDWVYVGLLFNAAGKTVSLMKSILGHDFDAEEMNAILNVLYNGNYFIKEEDDGKPDGCLVKVNVKTGEVVILMSKDVGKYTGYACSFRNAVEYNGKFYFCGAVNDAPQIWQVDPNNDECKKVYGMEFQDFYQAFQEGVGSGIRGMCLYEDELVISGVMKNAETGKVEPQIAITKNPEEGFEVIATQSDLFNYPAYHFRDSIYGGSIWEAVEFNGSLYVSICTGTPDNMPDKYTMQSFAIVRGDRQEDGSWKWTPVVGDQENDGARYTFGIDPERTRSGAGVIQVFNDYLYIGEYNDMEIALIELLFNIDFAFFNKNLEQSVSLYRMDKNENIELVMGNATSMFPSGSITGQLSGFGRNENQYVWKMTEYDGKLYLGTMDTSSLLYPLGQFANGDILHMSHSEWVRLLGYIRELLKISINKYKAPGDVSLFRDESSEDVEQKENVRKLFDEFDDEELALILSGLGEVLDNPDNLDVEVLSEALKEGQVESQQENEESIEILSDNREITDEIEDNIRDEDSIALDEAYKKENHIFESEDRERKDLQDNVDQIKDLIHIVKELLKTGVYMNKATRGFDLYVSEDGINFETVTIDGFGDPYNHGLRVFAEAGPGLCIGTANPFYGTQLWFERAELGYKATHTFVSGTVGKDLPDEVKVLLPMDKEGLADGAVVTPAVINQTTVTVADGTWTFDGWNPEEATINKADVNFVGTWTFTKKDTPPIPKHPKVIFDKNTTQYGDSSNQIHAVVALGANENTVGDKMPGNPNYSDYEFIGWNTKVDGTGFVFTKDTIVDRDITVYAQWKLKVKPEVKPDYNPLIPFIFDYNHYFETVLKSDRHFKYMFGYPNGTFLPNGNMTRAEATAMFNRILFNGVDSDYIYDGEFTDINPNDWYAKVVGYMTKYGFIKGYPDGSFKPNQPITRAEFASIAAKVSQVENAGAGSFTDVDSNYWAYGDINKLVREGWIEGYEDGTFKPENEITRSESVTIANKMQIRYPDKEYIDAKKALLESYTDLDETHWAYYQIMEAGNGHEFERLGNGKDERWKVLIDLGDIMNTK